MSQAAKVQEPSMEDILASIRRIIADDEAGNPAAVVAPVVAAAPTEAASTVRSIAPVAAASSSSRGPQSMIKTEAEITDLDRMRAMSPAPETSHDVLELTPAMEARDNEAPAGFHTISANSDVMFAERDMLATGGADRLLSDNRGDGRTLLSDQVTTAVSSAFGSLAHTVLLQNARTLDDLVRDMLRPMLKGWLEDNLPTIVERLVRAEIERVSRGRG
jgi:cell pole-organizing protein PopZ